MTARRLRSSALLGLLLLVAAGCATVPPVPRQPIGADARRALVLLRQRGAEFSGLRTLADLVVQRGSERHQLRGVLLVRAPASVRFEALSPMGQPLLLVTIHAGQLTAYDVTTDEAHVGPATAEVTARVLGLPFEPEDLVATLAGHAVPPEDVRVAGILEPDQVGPSLELTGQVNRRRIWMDLQTGAVQQVELTGGRAEARIRYHRSPDGELAGFDLTAMLGWIAAAVRYRTPIFGADLPDGVFSFTVPNSAKIQAIR